MLKSTAPLLSLEIRTERDFFDFISSVKFLIHIAFAVQTTMACSSVFVADLTIVGYSKFLQLTTAPCRRKTYPVVDFKSFLSLACEASQKAVSLLIRSDGFLVKFGCRSAVPFRYSMILFTQFQCWWENVRLKRLTTLIEYAMSGRLICTKYVSSPIAF